MMNVGLRYSWITPEGSVKTLDQLRIKNISNMEQGNRGIQHRSTEKALDLKFKYPLSNLDYDR